MSPVFGYWVTRGLAEPIRLLLHHAGVSFEDKRYQFSDNPSEFNSSEWAKDKIHLQETGLDFPNMPYYVDGDIKITQSIAIIRYLARKHGLFPTSESDILLAETLEQLSRDIFASIGYISFKSKAPIPNDIFKKRNDDFLKMIEDHLGDNDWLVNNKLSYVDFLMYEAISHQTYLNPDALLKCPVLARYLKRVETLPNIEKYMKEGSWKEWPIYGPYSSWGGDGEKPERKGLL